MNFNQLNKFIEKDIEKLKFLKLSRYEIEKSYSVKNNVFYNWDIDCEMADEDFCLDDSYSELKKICPKCGEKFSKDHNFCPNCFQTLKDINDEPDIRSIVINPKIEVESLTKSNNILTDENLELINRFDFTVDDFKDIIHSIKSQAFKNLDDSIRENSINLDDLDVLDNVLLFTKSFVDVDFKSYGTELGYFEFNKIYIDDRQRKSLQITTLIHELTHFLLKEILVHITCTILDVAKNEQVESVILYILSSSVFNKLIDEYAAHTVEGRFTIFGYQDYSSFIVLQNDLEDEHVEIAKAIGNTFSAYIKDILEGFLDWDLREEIKEQFLVDTIEKPDYSQLRYESCNKLSEEGFIKAIELILTEGFQNIDTNVIDSYVKEFGN